MIVEIVSNGTILPETVRRYKARTDLGAKAAVERFNQLLQFAGLELLAQTGEDTTDPDAIPAEKWLHETDLAAEVAALSQIIC